VQSRLSGFIQCRFSGLILHSEILWQEGGGEPPNASLGWVIDTQFGSLEALIQKVNAEGAALQGSGWVVSF
jgi:Fe-Mn family superoxide dismutase